MGPLARKGRRVCRGLKGRKVSRACLVRRGRRGRRELTGPLARKGREAILARRG